MEDKITIECKRFIKGIEKVSYAVARRKEMAGKPMSEICLSIGGGKIDFVATDGHRLVLYSTKLIKDTVLKRRSYIVPVKEVRDLINRISEDENLEITVENNKIVFNSLSHSLTCDLIEGKFPSYYKVIPTIYNVKLKVSKSRLADALRSVVKDRLYRSEEVGSFERIRLTPLKNKLIVSTLSPKQPLPEDYRSKVYEVVVEAIYNHFVSDSEDFGTSPHIYLNEMYVRQALNSIDGAKAIIRFINEYKPVAITSPDPNDGYLALIMPMNPDGDPQDQLAILK